MYLKSMHLFNFKNHEDSSMVFSPEINCLIGSNGSGKTNILDAIHYLSITKGAFSSSDNYAIKHDCAFFAIKGIFVKDKEAKVVCSLKDGEKKQVKINDFTYDKISDHVGKFPSVMIAPDDISVIKDGSEERRKFFDAFISQLNQEYLHALIHYNRFLKQRNSLLKQMAESRSRDYSLIETYNEQLAPLANQIHGIRKNIIQQFEPVFIKYYDFLAKSKEEVGISYQSDLTNLAYQDVLLQTFKEDLKYQRTTHGVHTDDFHFTINGFPLRKIGSQGQQKTYLIALNLAKYELLNKHLEVKPLLLLDDIFDKLDDERISKILELISNHTFGQLFITDARPERTKQLMSSLKYNCAYFSVNNGQVVGIKN